LRCADQRAGADYPFGDAEPDGRIEQTLGNTLGAPGRALRKRALVAGGQVHDAVDELQFATGEFAQHPCHIVGVACFREAIVEACACLRGLCQQGIDRATIVAHGQRRCRGSSSSPPA